MLKKITKTVDEVRHTLKTKNFGQFKFRTSRYSKQMSEIILSENFDYCFYLQFSFLSEIHCPKY